MTREEAIDLLSEITMYCDFTDEYGDYINDEPYITAVEIAIKALEQEPCEDCVSRQAVAEILLKYAHTMEGKAFAEFLVSQINELPSVTPQPYKGESEDAK